MAHIQIELVLTETVYNIIIGTNAKSYAVVYEL